MATNGCDVNRLESDSLLPPRKRLLAGFKKQNFKISNGSPNPSFASSSSTSNSNSFSSASADVQTHLHNLLTSQLNDHTPDELAQASKVTAALALKVAKAARATANEKALIASKAVAAAKTALELFASFPAPRENKQKKHIPVHLLYSKGVATDEDLTRRLNRAINNSPRVLRTCSGHKNKKQKTVVTYENSAVTSTMYDGDDVAGVVDTDSSNDDDITLKEKTGEESSSLGKRKERVKLKKLPLSMCSFKDQENEISRPLAQPEGSGVAEVRS